MKEKEICGLCKRSGQSRTSGPLSTQGSVTAHESCLLYSSGLYCENSPLNENLCGFPVKAIEEEIKRGNRLSCHKCKVKGATVGCELRKCKRSYHYPCAKKDGAEIIRNSNKGIYKVYCEMHSSSKRAEDTARKLSVNGCGNAEVGPFSSDSDSDASRHSKHMAPMRPLISSTTQVEAELPELPSSQRKKKRRVIHDSDSGEDEVKVDMEFAPLESDIDSEQYRVPGPQPRPQPQSSHSKDDEIPGPSTSGHPSHHKEEDEDIDTSIDTDVESQSLLLPVKIVSVSQFIVNSSGPSSPSDTGSPQRGQAPADNPTGIPSAEFPSSPERCHASASRPSPSPHASPSTACCPTGPDFPLEPSLAALDSAGFWRNCNQAGCTEAIFKSFITNLMELSERIRTDQATQEDYDVSLRMLEASGKLASFMTQLSKDLEEKQRELQSSLAAIKSACSVLK